MNRNLYQSLVDFSLSHNILVKSKDIQQFNLFCVDEIKWILKNTSDNVFFLINDINRESIKYLTKKHDVNNQIKFIEFIDEMNDKVIDDDFINNNLLRNQYNHPSWLFINNIDNQYMDILKKFLKGGRKYRLNIICYQSSSVQKIEYMFDHHIEI